MRPVQFEPRRLDNLGHGSCPKCCRAPVRACQNRPTSSSRCENSLIFSTQTSGCSHDMARILSKSEAEPGTPKLSGPGKVVLGKHNRPAKLPQVAYLGPVEEFQSLFNLDRDPALLERFEVNR